ncbi:hypothetical protein BJ165DRAFT_184541 [Panaeolus papilionaceus]|nr:hypothetical protein BJ165DRAFT_184541 [Panaeolus papilionaceus]
MVGASGYKTTFIGTVAGLSKLNRTLSVVQHSSNYATAFLTTSNFAVNDIQTFVVFQILQTLGGSNTVASPLPSTFMCFQVASFPDSV